jgi:hypothetical protein
VSEEATVEAFVERVRGAGFEVLTSYRTFGY